MRTSLLAALPLALVLLTVGCGRGDGDEDLMMGTEAGTNRGETGIIAESTHEGTGDPAKAVAPGPGTAGETSGTMDRSGTIGSGVDAQGGGASGVTGAQGGGAGEAEPNPATEDGAGSDPGDN